MLPLQFAMPHGRPLSLLAVGAHPDDIEIGAGGLLLGLAEARPTVRYVLLTGTRERHQEARNAAASFLPGATLSLDLYELPEGRLPALWAVVKDILEGVARSGIPDLIIAPSAADAHQDHRIIGEILPTVFRDHLCLAYEIPKWDGDMGRPAMYYPMTEGSGRRKLELLHKCYPSQRGREWWDDEVFLGLARLRGVECHARYAEAFYCAKSVIVSPVSEPSRAPQAPLGPPSGTGNSWRVRDRCPMERRPARHGETGRNGFSVLNRDAAGSVNEAMLMYQAPCSQALVFRDTRPALPWERLQHVRDLLGGTVSVRSSLGAGANKLLRPLNIQLIPGTSPDPAIKSFLPARKTIAAAKSAGLSVSAYIDKTHVKPGATAAVVKEMLTIANLSDKCEIVCEIGTGSGRFAEEVIAAVHPSTYEIYETARDWLPYLEKLPNAVIRDSDGHSLAQTPDDSVDLVHAQKLFVYLPFHVTAGYIAEMARVVRPGGTAAFDVVTEDCMDEPTVRTWIRNGSIYCPLPKVWLLSFLADCDLTLAGSFFTPLPPGKAEVLVLHKKG